MLALCHDNRSSLFRSEMSLFPSPFIPLSAFPPFLPPIAFIIIIVSTFIYIASAGFVASMLRMEELMGSERRGIESLESRATNE